jgi:NAD(P)H dehydrogenase (quinone)
MPFRPHRRAKLGDRIFASGGNPYGTTVTANGEPVGDAAIASIQHQARRLVEIAGKIAG